MKACRLLPETALFCSKLLILLLCAQIYRCEGASDPIVYINPFVGKLLGWRQEDIKNLDGLFKALYGFRAAKALEEYNKLYLKVCFCRCKERS